jgi:hypothetical protein
MSTLSEAETITRYFRKKKHFSNDLNLKIFYLIE